MKRKAPHYIKFPKTRLETSECIEKFRISTNCKIPQVAGAVDGKPDYFSRKQCHTITTQAVVGADLLFLDVVTGFPGSSHDAQNLRNTSLFRKSESREILSKPKDAIKSSKTRPLIVGDGAYPLLPWLLTPFQYGPALTRHEKKFNKKLSSVQVTVERAFGTLKARWCCLLKRLDNRIKNITVVTTCCVLHNICQMRKDEHIDKDGMLDEILRKERARRQNRRQEHDAHPAVESVYVIR